MPKKCAVGCIRVSTEEQTEGWSLEGQEQQIRDYAERNGYEIIRMYRDESAGTKDRRPGFDRMLDDAHTGLFKAIIVIHTSRFFRNVALAHRYKDELRNRLGAEVLFVNQPILDSSDHTMFMMEMINELFDEYYTHQLRFWTMIGKKTRAQRGMCNGTLPFGYMTDDEGMPVPHPKNSEGLRLAFESYSTGRYSGRTVAILLNRKGYRTTGNWGERKFTKDTVNRMLKNVFYLGYTKYKGELMEGEHEALIDEEPFNKCQQVRASRRTRPRAVGQKKKVYLFSGLARCLECELTLRCQSTSSKGKYRYYRHTAKVRGYKCSVPGKMVRADKLEKQWSSIVSQIRLPADWRQRIEELAGDAEERVASLRERGELEEKLRRLTILYRDLVIDDESYREQREQYQRRLASLVLPENPKLVEAGTYLERLGELWEAASLEERRDITRIMVKSVFVDVLQERIIVIEPIFAFRVLLQEICTGLEIGTD